VQIPKLRNSRWRPEEYGFVPGTTKGETDGKEAD